MLIFSVSGEGTSPIPRVVVNPFRYGQTNGFKKWGCPYLLTSPWMALQATIFFQAEEFPCWFPGLERKTYLVGGWTNPSEKYARQNGNLLQIGMNIKNVWNHHLDIQAIVFRNPSNRWQILTAGDPKNWCFPRSVHLLFQKEESGEPA